MLSQIAPGCGLHHRAALPCLPARGCTAAVRRRAPARTTAGLQDSLKQAAEAWKSRAAGLSLALAFSVLQAASVGAAPLQPKADPYQELQKIVSGRSAAPSPDGLLKSFQKSKAAQALQQAVTAPGKGISAPPGSAAPLSKESLGEGLKKAFTTSPPQIAQKAAPVVPSSPGLDPTVLVAVAAALAVGGVTLAGRKGAGSKAQGAAKSGAKQLKARVQAPTRQVSRQASKSAPAKAAGGFFGSKQASPAKAASSFGSQARKVATAASQGTTKVAKSARPGTQPSGGLFGTQRVSGGVRAGTAKVRARPPSAAKAQKGRGGKTQDDQSGSPNSILTVGIAAGGLVVAGALFAAIPKPDFYAKTQNASELNVPDPLPAKRAAVKYAREKLFEESQAPDVKSKGEKKDEGLKLPSLPFAAPQAPPKPSLSSAGNVASSVASKVPDTPKPSLASAGKVADKVADKLPEAPKPSLPSAGKVADKVADKLPDAPKPPKPSLPNVADALPDAPKPPSLPTPPSAPSLPSPPPAPSLPSPPSTPSGPDLKPEQAQTPKSGIPLAPPPSEANKPKTPSGPELAPSTPPPAQAKPQPAADTSSKTTAVAKDPPATKPGEPAAAQSTRPSEKFQSAEQAAKKPAAALDNSPTNTSGIPRQKKDSPAPLEASVQETAKPTKASAGKSSSGQGLAIAGGIVLAIGGAVVALSPKEQVGPSQSGGASAGGSASGGGGGGAPASSKQANADTASGDSKSAAKAQTGASTTDDIQKRKAEVQEWIKEYRNRS